MQRALVIGATGFIGDHILRALVHKGVEAAAMRRWNSQASSLGGLGVESIVADLLDRETLVETLAGFNYVFVASAPDPSKDEWAYLRESVIGMRNLLAVARDADVERVIVTSCASTIAPPTRGRVSTAADVYLPGTAQSNVVEAQYAVEQECFRQAADGMDLLILNPGICIGDGAVLPSRKLLKKVSDDAPINVVDVDDVARAHVAASVRQSFGERFVLGGENTTVGELYARLEPAGPQAARLGRYEVRLSDDPAEIRHLPLFRQGVWLDNSRAEREFGFRPRSL
ncbi:NAD-dependent epimerase/dehydratase family protein [Persicimonas caeni]|nr:NAD-dependent epimerase/dehydratase family protein [Persicimonas caeni]